MPHVPYSGKVSRGAKFHVFRGQGGMHENLNSGVNMTSLLEMRMCGAGDRRRARKLKTRKFLLEAPRANSWKYAPTKISRYTVYYVHCVKQVSVNNNVATLKYTYPDLWWQCRPAAHCLQTQCGWVVCQSMSSRVVQRWGGEWYNRHVFFVLLTIWVASSLQNSLFREYGLALCTFPPNMFLNLPKITLTDAWLWICTHTWLCI